ncbi:MAG TPA: serine hydrolase [Candidatus Polarisedimenticolia bacterium]|nr:serine hydrolase [Candidatus Polarisedimenticolia bacterium]
MRMRRFLPCLTMLLVLLPETERPPQPREMPVELDEVITRAMREWDVPGLAVAIVKDDQVVAARGYGVREVGKPGRVDGRTLFDVASLTKSFTAAAAAVLVDEGTIGWDDRIRERLPSVVFRDPFVGHEVTLRDLLSHRTGLQPANALFYFARYDRAELMRRVRTLRPQGPFRGRMVYSNILYTVAGETLAAAAGTTWADLVRTRLIEPAGMRSTLAEARPEGPNVARPHAVLQERQQPIRPFDFAMVGPASSIHSNAEDMARWLRLHLNGGTLDGRRVISAASMAEMHTPHCIIATTPEMRKARNVRFFGGYGLGWQVMDHRGHPMLWHSGNADGMPAYMALLPEQGFGLVVMLNTWGAPGLHGALVTAILDHHLGLPPTDPAGESLARHRAALREQAEGRRAVEDRRKSAPTPQRPLSDYAGVYEDETMGLLHVRLTGEGLTLQVASGASGRLEAWDKDSFLVAWDDPVFREYFYGQVAAFAAGEDGRIARLALTLNRDKVDAARRP